VISSPSRIGSVISPLPWWEGVRGRGKKKRRLDFKVSITLNNPYQQYQQNAILTAPAEKQVLMLYDGTLRFLQKALDCLEKKDFSETHEALVRVQDIIIYLRSILDKKYEVAHSLESIYNYLEEQLVMANLKKDGQIMKEVFDLCTHLHQIWQEGMNNRHE